MRRIFNIRCLMALLLSCMAISQSAIAQGVVVVEEATSDSTKVKAKGAVRHLPMMVTESNQNLVGASTRIDGERLKAYPDALLTNTMQGLGLGLSVINSAGGMANNPAALYVRGLSRYNSAGAITVVDGMERPIDEIYPEEIESVEILKDAMAKILFGARGANGVILITTKRGKIGKRQLKISTDYGVGLPTRMPEFINSYDYATLHNEARTNDGFAPLYSDADLQAYKNSTGENDLLHPDVDYYDYFLRNFTTYSKTTAEISGGDQNTRYSVVMGYLNYSGLQDVGVKPVQNRFNLRGNLDVNINKSVSAFMNIAATVDNLNQSSINHSATFGMLSTHRPNEYPLVISEEYLPINSKGIPALGASQDVTRNMLGASVYEGDVRAQEINGFMNFGMNFDLAILTEGLSAKSYVAFDNYFSSTEDLTPAAATYEPYVYINELGEEAIGFNKMQNEQTIKNYSLNNQLRARRMGFNAQLNYKRSFGESTINSTLGYYQYLKENQGATQDIRNNNIFLRANYAYKNKYVLEGNLAQIGSNRFEEDSQYFSSYAFGGAWILSEEDFLADSELFNYLKLKASYGVLGYDAATSHNLYRDRWYDNGNVNFSNNNSTTAGKTAINIIGASGLEWETSTELNVGIEGNMLNERLAFEFNYFNENRANIIERVDALYSGVYGWYYPSTNWGEVTNQGVEGYISWNDKVGELNYQVGANFIFSRNEVVAKDEIEYEDEYRRTVGLSSDAMMGYETRGLFGKDVPLEGAPTQTFGEYGIGDLAYVDQNGDGIIDDLDKVEIGNSYPTTTLGLDINLKYKNWGLYVLGTAALGIDKTFNNTYYANNGNSKYSTMAFERYHPTANPSGTYPSLTTTNATNNTVASDFWTRDASYFRLKNIELSYTFSPAFSGIQPKVKVYARGTNLFVLSDEKDLDPETPNGGITNYPMLTTLVGGVSVSF